VKRSAVSPFKHFKQLHIPLFDGKRDPIECENWLINVEEILRLQAALNNIRCNTWLIDY
jgi:hypothetical protein